MRKIISALVISLTTVTASAQQLPQFTQYILNDYVIVPAKAGVEEFYEAKTNYSTQWVGINDAPRTYVLSVNGPLEHEKMGIGGYLYMDQTGPTKRFGFNMSYSYHVKLNDFMKLSMAVNAGLLQYSVDGSAIDLADENDNVLSNKDQDMILPEAGFSFYLYGEDFFFGASIPQLLQNRLDFTEPEITPKGRLTNHYYMIGGYRYELNQDFELEPSILLKYSKPTPMAYELSLRGIYQDMAWLGFSYRKNSALALMAGFKLQNNLSFGYSYDFIEPSIRKYSSGTHEIMLCIQIEKRSSRDGISE